MSAIPADERVIKNVDSTDYPLVIVATKGQIPGFIAGPWFGDGASERAGTWLDINRHHLPRGACLYTASGIASADYRHLCETGRLP